ncbi:MAG: M48 family metallopeptidase [Campylobacteraceae bacterium]|jgi:Zn-dependent protease with chaperone function|nr:M48 family metallopeptidase [Campylobacteraceae bacterium]
MNFFEQQKRAEKNSKLLIVLFFVGVMGVCLCVSGASLIIIIRLGYKLHDIYPISHVAIASFFVTLMIIFFGSIYKILQLLKYGGVFIAQSLGGIKIIRQNADANEITLLNIVEEMSIASGIPVPPVYLLEDESINAFVAGSRYDDAVVGVTKGAIIFLERDELQGVIAHEFSHIFNGDMKLNIRSIGILNGILFIGLIGEFILKSINNPRGNKKADKAMAFLFFTGLFLYIIGITGVIFGNLIKAAINRQREYLADASAIQFTRYPQGLANALKKIGGSSSTISSKKANEFSHIYFSNGVKNFLSFNTHPPLDKRIKAIQPSWNGQYIVPAFKKNRKEIQKAEVKTKEQIITTATVLNEINNIGVITSKKLHTASEKIDNIPKFLYDGTADKLLAQLIIFVLLLDKDENMQKTQIKIIEKDFFTSSSKTIAEKFENIRLESKNLSRDIYLNLIQIAMPTLKALSKEEYIKFKSTILKLIEADKNVSWFELNLKHLTLYPLDITFGIRNIPREIYSAIEAIKFEVEIILSAVIYSQFLNDEKADKAFMRIIKVYNTTLLKYIPHENISLVLLENAYHEIQKTKSLLRKKILEMAIACLKVGDGKLSRQDIETIHALCALLHLPVSI